VLCATRTCDLATADLTAITGAPRKGPCQQTVMLPNVIKASLGRSQSWLFPILVLVTLLAGSIDALSQGIIDKILTIKTCGKPNIQNIMSNVTVKPGQSASFKCQVDMSCIVAYIEWYHEMDNGTLKLIKTASSSGDPHVHIIKMVRPEDEGLYTCIAGNFLGQAEASAYLEVNSAMLTATTFTPMTLAAAAALYLLVSSLFTQHLLSSQPHHSHSTNHRWHHQQSF